MPVEQYTCFRMLCDDCRVVLYHKHLGPVDPWADFVTEDDVMAEARRQEWYLDPNTADWYCPDCQKERQV